MSIRIFYDNTTFRLRDWKKTREIVNKVIRNEKRISGDLNFIITDTKTLREINIRFMEHDYDTDVITFNYNDRNSVNGEIYISIDMVKTNSINYNVSLKDEVNRVIIHGTLHLVDYDDKNKKERNRMREMENAWLKKLMEE